jgi:hypothetical protein
MFPNIDLKMWQFIPEHAPERGVAKRVSVISTPVEQE